MPKLERVALLADVHGNALALEAVLADLDRLDVETILDAGDVVFGPLEPRRVLDLFRARGIPAISGNQDRVMMTPERGYETGESWQHTRAQLDDGDLAWLAALPKMRLVDDVFLCHGTPSSDVTYLTETVTAHGVFLSSDGEITGRLAGSAEAAAASLIVCGHAHFPRVITLGDGRTVVNPGSVGLAAFEHDEPFLHDLACGSPHARYAIATRRAKGWDVELRAVAYDWHAAADAARARRRHEWETWLRWGRVQAP